MKSKLLLYTLLSASMLSLGSCKSHRSMNIVDQALFQVQPGMTFAQVQAILDKPDYRRFNQEFEQWEYRRIIKRQPVEVILLFKDGALCEMDSFRPVLDPTEHPFVSHSSATASAPHDSFPDGPQEGMPYADFNRMCSLISAVTLKL